MGLFHAVRHAPDPVAKLWEVTQMDKYGRFLKTATLLGLAGILLAGCVEERGYYANRPYYRTHDYGPRDWRRDDRRDWRYDNYYHRRDPRYSSAYGR